MSKFLLAALTPQLPFILLYLAGLVLAIVQMRRMRRPAVLVLLGCALGLATIITTILMGAHLMHLSDAQAMASWSRATGLVDAAGTFAVIALLITAAFSGRRAAGHPDEEHVAQSTDEGHSSGNASSGSIARPTRVIIAVGLLFVSLVVGTLSSYYQQAHNPSLSTMQSQLTMMLAVRYSILIGSVILNLFLQYKIFMGRNWARITALVLFLLALLMSIPGYIGMLPLSTTFKVMGAVLMLAQMVAYVLVFTGSASAWFKRSRAG